MTRQSIAITALALQDTLGLGRSATAQGRPALARGADAELSRLVVLEGWVYEPDGAPADGAVVVSDAGGRGVADRTGRYRIELRLPIDARSVLVTAAGPAGAASVSTSVSATTRPTRVDPLALVQGGTCPPSWVPTFGGRPGTDGPVLAMAVYDDGSGPELYVGGTFTLAGGIEASNIAKWDGSRWEALGSGVNGTVRALCVFDDGGGPDLYVGGEFTLAGAAPANRITRWDGSGWSPLGQGMNGGVYALAVYDDGGGPALFAGGTFSQAGGMSANRIAKWNGNNWQAMGSGLQNGGSPIPFVAALAVYDDGTGSALYAAGEFLLAGGDAANRIARWNGSTWSPLGSGTNHIVRALEVHDDGSGSALHAAGEFTSAGGSTANWIARWDGSGWGALGSGLSGPVLSLTVYDDGGGPAPFAGGGFTSQGDLVVNHLVKWDGASWAAPRHGVSAAVKALAVHDDGGGPALYAGGAFTSAGGVSASQVARWDGAAWSALGLGVHGSNPSVNALAVYDDGSGPALYAGGVFTSVAFGAASCIAKWDGSRWRAVGSGLNGGVQALVVHDDGSGPELYAGGGFTSAGGLAANGIARWDGTSWSALGGGVSGGSVLSLCVFDDESGPRLYAGGTFTAAEGAAAERIAQWDGSSWSALGGGVAGNSWPFVDEVSALAVFGRVDPDIIKPSLIAGGDFLRTSGGGDSYIARWGGPLIRVPGKVRPR